MPKFVIVNIATTGLDHGKHGIMRAVVIPVDSTNPRAELTPQDYLLALQDGAEVEPKAIALHKGSGLFARYGAARKANKLTPLDEFLSGLKATLSGSSALVLGQGGWALPWLRTQRYLDPVYIAAATQLEYPKIAFDAPDLELKRAVRDALLVQSWLRLFTPQTEASTTPAKAGTKGTRPLQSLE